MHSFSQHAGRVLHKEILCRFLCRSASVSLTSLLIPTEASRVSVPLYLAILRYPDPQVQSYNMQKSNHCTIKDVLWSHQPGICG